MKSETPFHITSDLELSEVILYSPKVMLLIEHFNIHVPLHEKTISEICIEKKISTELFITLLNLYQGAVHVPSHPFPFSEIPVIIDFLKNGHAYYTNEIYPDIQKIIKSMYDLNNVEEMLMVEKFFNEYFNEVMEHLDYENRIAFPYMTDLYQHLVNNKAYNKEAEYSVKEYKEHHDDIEEKLDDLQNLLIKYLPQQNDQQLRRKLFFNLVELDYDLKIHARIEDFILIPLVEQMEQHLKNSR